MTEDLSRYHAPVGNLLDQLPSAENSSHHPRRAVVINLCRDGTHSDSDEPLLQGMPVVARGTPLGGQFFPLLGS